MKVESSEQLYSGPVPSYSGRGKPGDDERLARALFCGHDWGPWENDVAGAVRECRACGSIDFRPEG